MQKIYEHSILFTKYFQKWNNIIVIFSFSGVLFYIYIYLFILFTVILNLNFETPLISFFPFLFFIFLN